jgi:hypothetical protein
LIEPVSRGEWIAMRGEAAITWLRSAKGCSAAVAGAFGVVLALGVELLVEVVWVGMATGLGGKKIAVMA